MVYQKLIINGLFTGTYVNWKVDTINIGFLPDLWAIHDVGYAGSVFSQRCLRLTVNCYGDIPLVDLTD
jgi:hypothetical protein